MSAEPRVRVLYDYDYESVEGVRVVVKRGEELRLLDTTTDEWWKVSRDDESPFFVPANYVTSNGTAVASAVVENRNEISQNVRDASVDNFVKENSLDSAGTTSAKPEDGDLYCDNEVQDKRSEVLYENLEIIQAFLHSQSSGHNGKAVDTNAVASTPWELHTDEDTGRIYYYNPVTEQTTWDPPPALQSAEVTAPRTTAKKNIAYRKSFSEALVSSRSDLMIAEQRQSLSKGWKEVTEDSTGETCFVHETSGERWVRALDATGRKYYYNANSQESMWDLPELNATAEQRATVQRVSKSLSRSKWPWQKSSRSNSLVSDSLMMASTLMASRDIPDGHALTKAQEDPGQSERITSWQQEKRGSLNRCRILEAGKKVKKNWNESFVATSGTKLIFYKDEKSSLSTLAAPDGKPEAIIDLKEATVQWTEQKTSKKNVLEVTSSGSQFLLQHDDTIVMYEWCVVLRERAAALASASSLDDVAEADEHSTGTQKSEAASVLVKFMKLKLLRGVSFTLKPNSDQPKIKEKLKYLLTKRPTLESLELKGIIQESIFNAHLQRLCEREHSSVPRFVEQCVATIEAKGLDDDGLYRISGNMAEIQSLRFLVNQNDKWDLSSFDVHVLTGALKLFFRELPEPLIPLDFYDSVITCIRDKNLTSRLSGMKLLLSSMPSSNRATLHFLMSHLSRVSRHSDKNRMTAHSLAIVFGPSLMWPETQTMSLELSMMCQNSVVEYLLLNIDKVL